MMSALADSAELSPYLKGNFSKEDYVEEDSEPEREELDLADHWSPAVRDDPRSVQQCLLACKEGRQDDTIRLLRSINDPFALQDENGATIAHFAASHGWYDFLKELNHYFELPGGQRDNDKKMLRYLQQEDNNGKTPLQYASENNQFLVMGLLSFARGMSVGDELGEGRRRPEDIIESIFNVAPSIARQCLPAAANVLPSGLFAGKDCNECQRMHQQVSEKREQVELLAKQCINKEKEKEKLQKKLKQLQVSDLPDMMEATADIQTQWREMGEALGVSTTVLDEISSLIPCDELRCLYEMLRHWILDIGATWGGLVGAMRSSYVKQIDLAKDLEEKHHGIPEGNTLQIRTVVKDEEPIKESQVPAVVKAVFHCEDAHVDWKVLGLMLGLSDDALNTIESNHEEAVIKQWIQTGTGYWSVLVDVIAGSVIDERPIARSIAKTFLKLDLFLPEILEDDIVVSEKDITRMKQRISDVFGTISNATGIVFIIGMGDSAGTTKDGENIATTFELLKFAVFRMENSSREELSCLVKTAVSPNCFGVPCKNIAFYYAGHGGIDPYGNSFLLMNDGNAGKFFIDKNMIAHFDKNKLKKKKRCLFFFDCCLSGKLEHQGNKKLPNVPIRCLIAFATSMGLKSYGNCYTGGVWTGHLCSKLKEQLSVSDILDKTREDVGDEQPSVYLTCAGAVFLNGIPNYSTGDPLDISDPVKIWERHSKELIEQLGYNNNTLIALTAGLHIEDVIDKETKSAIFSASIDGGDILVKSVKEKLAGPKSLQLILDIMDQQDPLCGLVRRMRRDLGLLEDKPKNILKDHHDEINEILHTTATSTSLISLSGGFLSKGLIDAQIFHDVTKETHTSGPNRLLKYLEERVDKEPTLIISILDIMGKEEELEDVVKKMKEALKLQQDTSAVGGMPAKFLRPQQTIEQLEKENSELEEDNIQLQQRESYKLIKVPLVVFFVTMSMYFVIRRFR